MGNVQAGGHAPQETHPPPPPLIIEGMKIEYSPAALQTRANLTRSQCFIAASVKNRVSYEHGLRVDQKATDQEGFTAIQWSVLMDWPAGVTLALDSGIPVDAVSNEGYTSLHLASFTGSTECAAILVKAGANVNLQTVRGADPLGIAAQQGHASKEVLEFLLKNGAHLASYGYKSRNALEVAVSAHSDIEVIQTLLAAGADPSLPNPHLVNITSIHIAARMLKCDVVKTLLDAGGNPNAGAESGNRTPIMMVHCKGRASNNASISSSAYEKKKRAMVQVLAEAGADLSAGVSSTSFTILHCAIVLCKEEESIDQILAIPSCNPALNINHLLSPSKETMLHICAKNGWINVTRHLANAGANLEIEDKEGLTPLHTAVIAKKAGIVAELLHAGANPLSLGPDIFPDFNSWRIKQISLASRMFVEGVEPEEVADRLRAVNPQCTAIDTAFLVTQDIPVIEAFLKAGVVPSKEAREVGEQCVPMLKNIVERTPWSPEMHENLPTRFKIAAKELILSLQRAARGSDGQTLVLSQDVISVILTHALYPISQWATDVWYLGERVKDSHEVARPNRDPTAAAMDEDEAHAGIHHFFNMLPEPQELADMAAAAVAQIAQAAAGAGAPGQGGGNAPAPAAAGGGGAGGGAAAGAVAANINDALHAAIANAAAQFGMLHNAHLNPGGGPPGAAAAGAGGINAGDGNPPPPPAAAAAPGNLPVHHFVQAMPAGMPAGMFGMPMMQMQMPGGFMMMGGIGHVAVPFPDGVVLPGHGAVPNHAGGGEGDGGDDAFQNFQNFHDAAVMNAGMMGIIDAAGAHIANMLNGGADEDEDGIDFGGGDGGQLLHLQIHINVDGAVNNNNNNADGGLMNHPVAQHAAQFFQQQQNQHQQQPAGPAAGAEAAPINAADAEQAAPPAVPRSSEGRTANKDQEAGPSNLN